MPGAKIPDPGRENLIHFQAQLRKKPRPPASSMEAGCHQEAHCQLPLSLVLLHGARRRGRGTKSENQGPVHAKPGQGQAKPMHP